MPESYKIGQEVLIKPVVTQDASLRESAAAPYAGKTGTILNFYWITPPSGEVFYLYTVRVNNTNKEIVLYEDEISGTLKATPKMHNR